MGADLKKAFEGLKKRFKPGTVTGKTVYYFSLGDGADEKWNVTLTPTACTVKNGKVENADCVLKTSAELFLKLVDGSWKPGVMDVMSGKLKTSDPELLKALQKTFDL